MPPVMPPMGPLDIAREILPGVQDDILGYFLWNETAFPFCDELILREQLENLRVEIGAEVLKQLRQRLEHHMKVLGNG